MNTSIPRKPTSCDTFVVLPPLTAGGCVIFGKNADRPCEEVQEVVYNAAQDHKPGSKVQCTYIEIDQVPHTYEVVMSKPSWMWGAEMGSNEHGVCIGNEAVWTKLNSHRDEEERLLGMDLVRLGLERGCTAKESLDIMTHLLETHGQGGICCDTYPMTYHNSFMISDRTEAWILETAEKMWAAEQCTSGFRNISNQLTIRTKIDASSDGLQDMAKAKGWWNPDDGDFDFAKAFSDDFEETKLIEGETPCSRQLWGTKLLQEFSKEENFSIQDMFKVLRHESSGICMTGGFLTTGSQVSMVTSNPNKSASIHWFTATPNPAQSMFKPFIFAGNNAGVGNCTTSPVIPASEDPAKVQPRFQKEVDRSHTLWTAHEKLIGYIEGGNKLGDMILEQMLELEKHCVTDMENFIKNFDEKTSSKMCEIFKHMVDIEMNFYK